MELPDLPVRGSLGALDKALAAGTSAVLIAPPGAGKTTLVPLALKDSAWLRGGKIVMLEPRRLAARASARRMSTLLSEHIGGTVGYRVRADTRVGRNTRVEVVTEGVLTRMLQSDPGLDGVGLVVFDEFHERSLHADLGLALALQARRLFRPDLRILVMSATLDAAVVAALLGEAPIIEAAGRAYPVAVQYRDAPMNGRVEDAVVAQVAAIRRREANEATSSPDAGAEGDLLVFLPGVAEIRRTRAGLLDRGLFDQSDVHALHAGLSAEQQDRAIRPGPPGRRKVVLSTTIAQTSLTIEGVRVVIDSGLMRRPRFNPATGLTGLETTRVTADVAEQRRGRAGRVAPGICYRMWTANEQRALVPELRPEILDADLAPLLLELAIWGAAAGEMTWLDPPPAPAMSRARALLLELGALSDDGSATDLGRSVAALGTHPRLARMLIEASAANPWKAALAADLAALLTVRDVFRHDSGGHAAPDADLRLRLEALRRVRTGKRGSTGRGWAQVLNEARALRRSVGLEANTEPAREHVEFAGELLALAYPDRLGRRRARASTDPEPGRSTAGGRYLLRNGRGAALPEGQTLGTSEWIVACDLGDRGRDARIFRAAPIESTSVEKIFADRVESFDLVAWSRENKRVEALRQRRLGTLVVSETALPDPDPKEVRAALLGGLRSTGLSALPWNKRTTQLRQRLQFMHVADPEAWPDVSETVLLDSLEAWLGGFVDGMRRLEDLQALDLSEVLWTHAGWQNRVALDELAPTHLEVPSGSRIPLDYADPAAPTLAVRLQEVFGWTETPRIGGGRVAVTLRLLSPAQRPVQVTSDLASFWKSAYFEVKKDLKGRYPKHSWPDDPLTARATRRTRRR